MAADEKQELPGDQDAVVTNDDSGGDDEIEITESIVRRIDRLKELDQQREEKISLYMKERAELEAKYQQIYGNLYEERAAIVMGEKDVEANNYDAEKEGENATTGIPQFWVCAMGHMEDVGSLLAEDDIDCLEYLQDIQCLDDEDGQGFTLKFYFAENPYFENDVLTKRYVVPNLLMSAEPILKGVFGCKIQWKNDHALTYNTVTKKQRGKGKNAGLVRQVKKKEPKESFFNWFNPPQMPDLADELDEEEAADLEAKFDADYEIALAFRTHIIPYAVHWFTGEAAQPELEAAVEELIAASS